MREGMGLGGMKSLGHQRSQTYQLAIAALQLLLTTEGHEQVLHASAEVVAQMPGVNRDTPRWQVSVEVNNPHGPGKQARQMRWARVVLPNGETADVSAQVAVKPLLLGVNAAAEVLGISRNQLYTHINGKTRTGRPVRVIPSVVLCGRRLFAMAVLRDFLRETLREQGQAQYVELV